MYYHLGAFEDSLTYALGADSLFDVNGVSEYVETIIGMFFNLVIFRFAHDDSQKIRSSLIGCAV